MKWRSTLSVIASAVRGDDDSQARAGAATAWAGRPSRRPARWPPIAKASSGTAWPSEYASVSSSASSPTSRLAATTAMAASTGPAHGTMTRPRLAPSRKPPPTSRPLLRVKRASGRSTSTPTLGKISVAATRKSSARATFRSTSSGRPSRSSSHAAKSTESVKLTTRPATIAYGRRGPPAAEPASRTGSTGRTHGDSAVIRPATNPMPSRTSIRSRA